MAKSNNVTGSPKAALNAQGKRLHLPEGGRSPDFFGDPDLEVVESTLDWRLTTNGEFFSPGVRNPPLCHRQ